jgi:2-oxoglutarate ferredoxin oxidoreductase subunit beta
VDLGQFVHCVRRGVNMLYITEQRRVRPHQGPVLRHGRQGLEEQGSGANNDSPLDLRRPGMLIGATFVARSFSGDKKQLVPSSWRVWAIPDPPLSMSSARASFNNHAGSTKSFEFVRAHNER